MEQIKSLIYINFYIKHVLKWRRQVESPCVIIFLDMQFFAVHVSLC